jgi:hypothetical protein
MGELLTYKIARAGYREQAAPLEFAPDVFFRDYADVASYLFCMLFGLRQARVYGY